MSYITKDIMRIIMGRVHSRIRPEIEIVTVLFCRRYWHEKFSIYSQNHIWKSYWKTVICLHVFHWLHQSLCLGTTWWTSQNAGEFRSLGKGHTWDPEPILGWINLYKSRESDEWIYKNHIKSRMCLVTWSLQSLQWDDTMRNRTSEVSSSEGKIVTTSDMQLILSW